MYNEDSGFRKFAPVNVGDEIDVKIEGVGEKGDGIAKKEGFVLFVPNAKEGQEVRIKIVKVLQKVGFAEVVGESEGTPKKDKPAEENAPEQGSGQPATEESEEQKVDDTEDFGEEEKKE